MPPRLLQRLSWRLFVLLVVAAPFAQASPFPRYALSVSFDAAHSMLIGIDLPGPIRIDCTATFKHGDDNRVSADSVLRQRVWS